MSVGIRRSRVHVASRWSLGLALVALALPACKEFQARPLDAGAPDAPGSNGATGTGARSGPLDAAQTGSGGAAVSAGTGGTGASAVADAAPVDVLSIMTGAGGSGAAAVAGGTGSGAAGGAGAPAACVTGATRLCTDDPDVTFLGNCGAGVETCAAGKWGTCSIQPAAKDSCTLLGDDASCNSKPNEGCPCVDGDKQPCGPPSDMGTCRRGTQTCSGAAWGSCVGAIYSAPRDCTSPADNNCDGTADNTIDTVCTCAATTTRPCDEHAGKDGTGRCKAGSQTCAVAADKKTSTWGACSGGVAPAAKDTCETGNDDNCNGVPNEGCTCVAGTTQACGPAANVGICKRGTQTCTAGSWGACVGAVMPATRDCTSTADNDCDGQPDNTSDAVCACKSGATQACGQHPGQDGKGPCKAGSQACVVAADKKTSAWGPCTGAVGPAPADGCDTTNDDNCNGQPHEGCTCVNGTTRGCGPAAVGICKAGTQTCASSAWGTCVGATNAQARDCTSTKDNDCNGTPDNMDSTCACPASTTMVCAGNNTAPCSAGTKSCVLSADKGSTSWSTTCSGVIAPKARDCTSTLDNDCNGTVDNKDSSCACTPNTTMPCAGNNTPPCSAGTKTCVLSADKTSTSWSTTCSGMIAPKARDCTSTIDNDCNGTPDNLETVCMCAAGTHRCSGVCQPDTSTSFCGAPCVTCPPPPANAVATCNGGTCGVACISNSYKSCAGSSACIPTSGCCTSSDCKSGPSGTTGNCAANTCSYSCASGTHSCGGSSTCYSSTDTTHCGTTSCVDCTQPNAKVACGTGSSCNNSCPFFTLPCGGSSGKPNCGSWDFESGGTDGWVVGNDPTIAPYPSAAVGGTFSKASSPLGTNASLGVHYVQTGFNTQVLTVSTTLCTAGANLTGKSLSYRIYFDGPAYSTLTDGASLTVYTGGTSCVGTSPNNLPSGNSVVSRTAQFDGANSFSCNGGAISVSGVTTISIRVSLDQAWDGYVYFDDIKIQ